MSSSAPDVLADSMTVIAISEPGPPDVLKAEQRRIAVPHEGEVLIKVAAAGVNRPDVLQRQGACRAWKSPAPLSNWAAAPAATRLETRFARFVRAVAMQNMLPLPKAMSFLFRKAWI